jgi:hypothetical protein
MNQPHLEEFECSNQHIGDSRVLKLLFEREGYLFFRGLLDLTEVENVKQAFVGVLQKQGAVKAGSHEPEWTGLVLDQIDDNPLYEQRAFNDMSKYLNDLGIFERIFDGPVFQYANTDIRFALPNDERHLTPPHQDHFFIRQTDQFRTVWIPLIDINQDAGGLAIAKRSHLGGLLDHIEHETAYSYIFRGRKQRGVPLNTVRGPWLTTNYAPGDLLLFHSMMVHRALPNRSNRIRLSLDARFQPTSAPRAWQAERTILELRQYRKAIRALATAHGASESTFEAVLLEMITRGLNADTDNVRTVILELEAKNR